MDSSDFGINMAALTAEPALKLFSEATELIHGMSERESGQLRKYIQEHTSGRVTLEDFERGLEDLGFVKIGKFTSQHGGQTGHGKDTPWQDKVHPQKPLARMHRPHQDKFSSMEIRFLPPVRKLVDRLAASKGMAAAECVESLVVDAINKNPDLIEQGEKRLKEFGGNLTRAKRHAQEEKLARLEALETKHSPVRR